MHQSSRFPRLRGVRQLACVALVFLFIHALSASPAFATDYTVTKATDTNDGLCNADCSLREAIVAANVNADADRILLGSGLTYTLSLGPFDAFGVVAAGSGDLDITRALTIEGNGSTVDGAGIDRVFDIQGAFAVTINNLTIKGGVARGVLSLGGGLNIRGAAAVVLNSCVVTGNSTAVESGEGDAGGGIAVAGSFEAATGTATVATLALNNTTVSNNTASNGGGIVCVLCALTASRSNITRNTANGAQGGGIQLTGNSSTASVTSSAITLNAVPGGSGGGMSVPAGTSTSTLNRSRIASNTATTASGVFSNLGTVTATNDWWGCNYGPGAGGAGCASTANGVAGLVTTTPFLVLRSSASTATVLPGGSSTMTADLTFNSANANTAAGGAIPDWTIVTFSETFGSFATPSSPTTNGKATSIYTAGSASGWARLSASVDDQTVSAPVLVGTPSAVTGDYNADHSADLALFRPGNGNWMFRYSTSNFASGPDLQFGIATDKPVPGDYDGDGRIDMAVYRPSNGIWYVIYSSTGVLVQLQWGVSTDIPMQADYTGDGRTDLAVWRPSNGIWYIFDLSAGTFTSRQWGVSTDIPLTGDYDGDRKADVAV